MPAVLIRTGRDTSNAHKQRKGHMRTQQEGSHLQAKASEETKPADRMILDL